MNKADKILSIALMAILILAAIYMISSTVKLNKIERTVLSEQKIIDTIYRYENSYDWYAAEPQRIYELIKSLNIAYPEIVISQAILESSNFTSNLYTKNNNLFGMKIACIRPSTAYRDKDNSEYACYDNTYDCVLDYALWQTKYCRGCSNENDYYAQLKNSGYFSDPNYIESLKYIRNNLKSYNIYE